MRSTAEQGVWIEDISADIYLRCDTNLFHITAVNNGEVKAKFEYSEEFLIEDVIKVKESIERTCKLGMWAPTIQE